MLTQERKQFLHDVFVTALEGGIGYWSKVSDYHWTNADAEADNSTTLDSADLDGFYAVIHDFVAAESDPKATQDYSTWPQHRITRAVIQRGIGKVADKDFRVRDDIRKNILAGSAMNGAGDIDSECADVIVQAGLFGEIVYG
jgi:hypothetical protein